jgi:hypothetical protein
MKTCAGLVMIVAAVVTVACGQKDATPPATSTQAASQAAPAQAQPPAAPVAPSGFDQTLALQGITFRVTSPNDSSINKLTIVPTGLSVDNKVIETEVDGKVTRAEVADIDSNGSPEIYVFAQSAGSGSYGSVVAYAANAKKSLSAIVLPQAAENPKVSKGYMGHDAFEIVENTFMQRFPIYRDGDANAKPTGGMRQLEYKLAPGEAGWVLRLVKTTDF